MTLTFLLQLTDEEQLFALNNAPAIQVQEQGQVEAPATAPEEGTCALWPVVEEEDC